MSLQKFKMSSLKDKHEKAETPKKKIISFKKKKNEK